MTNLMQDLYGRLDAAGIDSRWVKSTALPDWWEDTIAQNPAGYAEVLSLLADHLSLNLSDLQDPAKPLKCEPFLAMRNKVQQGACAEDLSWARCVCARATQISCAATVVSPSVIPTTATEVRQTICNDNDNVHLETLLEYCWGLGIPVSHVMIPPKGSKKLDGVAARMGDRYAIVLAKNSPYNSWLLFILAHELGHIALRHIKENGLFVDENDCASDTETEEKAANDFAVELLTGKSDTIYETENALTAAKLANASRKMGAETQVDSGVIALNYVRHLDMKHKDKNYWGLATAALKILEPDVNAMLTIRNAMQRHLDLERLPDENRDFLLRITGIDAAL